MLILPNLYKRWVYMQKFEVILRNLMRKSLFLIFCDVPINMPKPVHWKYGHYMLKMLQYNGQ